MSEEHKVSLAAEQDGAVGPVLAEHAAEIRRLGTHAKENIIEIGRRLADAKKRAGHGRWLRWLDRELGWTDKSAQRFIKIYEFSQADIFKYDKLSNLELPISALYLLAASSTPDEARAEIIERAQAGESVPGAEIKQIIDTAKRRRQPARKPVKATKAAQAEAEKPAPHAKGGDHHGGDHHNGGADRDGDHGQNRGRDAGVATDIDELHDRLRRQAIQIVGLMSEIDELKAAPPTAVDHLTASQIVDVLESRLRRDGIEAAVQLRKIRDRINQHKPQINLKAMPTVGAA